MRECNQTVYQRESMIFRIHKNIKLACLMLAYNWLMLLFSHLLVCCPETGG